jgi:hypothetical protein
MLITMRPTSFPLLVLLFLLSTATRIQAQGNNAASAGPYSSRPLTLPAYYLRVDLAPSDYGYMDHSDLNNDRGMRIHVNGDNDVGVGLGVGAGYGILNELEVGALLFPFIFAPNGDFGDMEFYGRYAFLKGGAQLAGQFTIQIPTQTDFGMGFGFPARFTISSLMRIDTGVELEALFASHNNRANLDIPLALNFDVTDSGFVGLRTGVVLPKFKDAVFNLGVQGGCRIHPMVELSASVNWPSLFWTGRGDNVHEDIVDIIFGASIFIGL